MDECIGKYFIRNGQIRSCEEFDTCFLDDPFYLYEVFRVIEGIPLFFEDHHKRLLSTVKHWRISSDLVPSDLASMIKDLIEVNELKTGNMKIVVHRNPDDDCETVFLAYITPHQYPEPEEFDMGVDVGFLTGTRSNPHVKLMDVSLRKKANELKQKKKYYETLLVDEDDYITEGSRSNVFFIKEDKVITPPLSDVLPGVTRKHIIELCHDNSIPVYEQKVAKEEVTSMEGAFLSGTSRKVLPVKEIDTVSLKADHHLVRKIQKLFDMEVQNYVATKK